jgi:hypothetical protein
MDSTVDTAALEETAREIRAFLEERWSEWRAARGIPDPDPVSRNMCRLSAALLAPALEERHGGGWRVAGGCGEEGGDLGEYDTRAFPGGMVSLEDGHWHGHYWAWSRGLGLVVDVTADQFGHPGIVVTREDDPRYRRNYLQRAVDSHLRHVSRSRAAWLAGWRSRDMPVAAMTR